MENVSLALAFAAGLLSFVSPCVLALVPVYVAFLGEAATAPAVVDGAETGPIGGSAVSVLPQALLFVLGFSAVFVLLGTSLGLLGTALFSVNEVRQAAGIAVMAIGLVTTGVFGPVLGRLRIGLDATWLPAARSTRAVSLGALVAVGWSPCIGPVLGSILLMGASSQSAPVAALLLVAYSAGLVVPFLAAAVALPRMRPVLDAMRRHHRAVEMAAGLFIIGVGLLIYLNAFARLSVLFTFVI
ncbi:MAG: cytochrome c biogenesis protein CcdA [Candidatus Limnocylindria bacterium]